ncbi:MAG: hypothetical protein CME55_07465 [Halieaceae bacterium]|nr:hypothetical protein [Halieaceae bacterium]
MIPLMQDANEADVIMIEQVIDFEKFRAKKEQIESDQEVLRISEEVGSAAVALVRDFSEKYPALPDTFFAFLINQQLLSTACSGAETGHEGSKRLLNHALNLLEVYERYLNEKGQSFKTASRTVATPQPITRLH